MLPSRVQVKSETRANKNMQGEDPSEVNTKTPSPALKIDPLAMGPKFNQMPRNKDLEQVFFLDA